MLRAVRRSKTILRIRRRQPFITELERAEYDKLVKESRRINTQFYSDQQANIENRFIADFEKKEQRKRLADDLRLRTELVHRAWTDKKEMTGKVEKEQHRKRRLQRLVFEQISRRQQRGRVIAALDAEARQWISGGNSEVVAPDILSSQSAYFSKLQERAMLVAEGNIDELDEYNVESDILDYKNSLMIPMFSHIKNVIKLLIDSPFAQLQRQWQRAENCLDETTPPEQRKELRETYSELTRLLRAKHSTVEKSFQRLEEKIRLLCLLLQTWRRYTAVLLLSHEEARAAMKMGRLVENKVLDPLQVQEEYQRGLSRFFNGQGESLTDMEQMISQPQDLEEMMHEEQNPEAERVEFHRVLGQYISSDDIHAFEDEFDRLRVKYDSIYGEPTFSDLEKEEPLLTDSQARLIFDQDKSLNELSSVLEGEAAGTFTPISQVESSFFGHMLRERVNTFDGVIASTRLEKTKQLAAQISQTRIEEPSLLRKIIEAEINADLLLNIKL